MNDQRYRKVGKRYIPIGPRVEYDGWDPGSYLLMIKHEPGSRSFLCAKVQDIKQDPLGLLAAAQSLRGKLVDILYEAQKPHLGSPVSSAQKKAWDALEATGVFSIHIDSRTEIANKVLKAIMDAAKKKKQ